VVVDSRIEKWRRWCNGPISTDVHTMHLHRYALREVGDIIDANDELPPSYFFEYLLDTYAVAQAVAVRRQAETNARVITLGRLITEVRDDPERLTRTFWVGLWEDGDRMKLAIAEAAFTKQFAPDDGKHLDPRIPEHDLQTLGAAAQSVAGFVDQYLAHADAKPRADLPTFSELDDAVDAIGQLFSKYVNLLTASSLTTLVPVIQHDWLAVFRRP
jgi:hypothetical protein